MGKNDTVAKLLAKKAQEPDESKAITRLKTSIYVNTSVWNKFKKITKRPRGRTSELLEEFMTEYVRIHETK